MAGQSPRTLTPAPDPKPDNADPDPARKSKRNRTPALDRLLLESGEFLRRSSRNQAPPEPENGDGDDGDGGSRASKRVTRGVTWTEDSKEVNENCWFDGNPVPEEEAKRRRPHRYENKGSSFSSLQPGGVGSGKQDDLRYLQNSVRAPQGNKSKRAVTTLQPDVTLKQARSSQQHQQAPKLFLQSQQTSQKILPQDTQQLERQQIQAEAMMLEASQLSVHQMQKFDSVDEFNELMEKNESSITIGVSRIYEQHFPEEQRFSSCRQQPKDGTSFPVFSSQSLQAMSAQIPYHSSQTDQDYLLPSLFTQSASSPSIAPLASPLPNDSQKNISYLSSVSSVDHIGHLQMPPAPAQSPSLVIHAPWTSFSEEYISENENWVNVPSVSKRNATGRPLDRLIQVMKSLTPKALSSAVSNVESLVSIIDCLAGSAYNNDPMADIPEDLAATARCYLREGNFMSQDGSASINKIKSLPYIIPLMNGPSAGIVHDGFKQRQDSESFKLETTTNCRTMKQKTEVKHALQEEIRKINQMLIDTVVEICDEAGEEGIVVECSFTPVALSPSLKARITSAQPAPIKPLKLLVPANYPKSSPVILDKFHADEPIPEFEDLSMKAKSKFCIAYSYLSQSMTLAEMAKKWDACVRNTVLEYARQNGGGSFSTRYGSRENCVDF